MSLTAFNRSGGRLPLGNFDIQPQSYLEVDLADQLSTVRAAPPWREGSIHVDFFGDPDMLDGWLVTKSSAGVFEESLIDRQSLLDGPFLSFWDTTTQLDDLAPIYELHNAGHQPIEVRVRTGHGHQIQPLTILRLGPGSTTRVEPLKDGFLPRAWVEIEHDGEPGSLVLRGWLEGPEFVSRLPIHQSGPPEATHSYETIRVPLSGPESQFFHPMVALFNPTDEEQTSRLSWHETETGTVLAEIERSVPAREVIRLDSFELTDGLTLPLPEEARLRVSVRASGLLPWGVVLPRNGPPLDLAWVPTANAHGSGMYPLPNLDRANVFTTFVNLGSEPAELFGQITWKGGNYALGPLVIPAGASRRLDFRTIAREGPPDLLDRTLDPGYGSAFFQWLSHRGSTQLIARTEVQPRGGTDAFGFNCLNCCHEVPHGELIPGNLTFPVGQSPLFQTCVYYNTCTGTLGPYFTQATTLDYPAPFSWDGVRISASGPGSGTASFWGSELGTSLLCQAILFAITDDGPVQADPICEIKAPPSVKIGEPSVPFQTEIRPSGTASDWRLTQGDPVCIPLDTSGNVGGRAAVSAKAQMTCTINGQTFDSNEFEVEGAPTPQYVRLIWQSSANDILALAFSDSAKRAAVRTRVAQNLSAIFAPARVLFAASPSQGVTKITNLTVFGDGSGSQGGEASYDRQNFSRADGGHIFIGAGSLDIANRLDPVMATTIHERRDVDRVADGISRLAAHEIGHMLGLVPISTELTGNLWGNLAACHGISGLGLNGSSTHHNPSSFNSQIMAPVVSYSDASTWNVSMYSFNSTNRTYLTRVLP